MSENVTDSTYLMQSWNTRLALSEQLLEMTSLCTKKGQWC